MRVMRALVWSGVLLLAGAVALSAEVVRVEVDRREVVLNGRSFGAAGAYEKLVGRIFFALDPLNPANRAIVDLDLAPRNGDGRVEAWAEFMVLQPVDPARRRGVAWLEVSNRGGKASLRYFNRAESSLDPTTAEEFGDGLLMRQGLTLIWVGWQWDVPPRPGLVRLHLPFARTPEGPITGLARADWTVDAPSSVLPLAHRGHRAYAAVDPADSANVLTVRDGRDAPRRVIPREAWDFIAPSEGPDAGRLTMIRLDGGFQPGRIYELVYRTRDPRVVGMGLAAIRDVASYAKFALQSVFPAETVVAFGVSQTGRFLRHFLYQGFNVDEGGRRAVDGMLIHTAGAGRGSFNHRFAQPSRDAHRYSAFFYPTDIFPFTSREEVDPRTGLSDGLLLRTPPEDRPRVFYTNTGYEYWGRAASLIHTSPDGSRDVPPLPTERIYHLAGGQHFVDGFPPRPEAHMPGAEAWRGNPLNFLFTLRALALRLVSWVSDAVEPPPSSYPRLGDGTLVPPRGLAFPAVPGVQAPTVAHVAYRADYGPRFREEGIIDRQPPVLGPAFPVLVPQVDGLGNEESGVRGFELRVPVATYAPWSLRWGYPAARNELADFRGTWIPLPATEAERRRRGDPRPSLESLYGSRARYVQLLRLAARELAEEGFLLPEDVNQVMERGERLWDWLDSWRESREGERSGASRDVRSGRGS
ncbi:MAG: alpha/beta hydrolase domain-containing protein [Gemmatimonadota bacterium]